MARPARAADERLSEERAAVQRLLRKLATAGVALMLVVIVSSAYLRLSQAGLSCADWPACYGRIAPPSEVAPVVGFARLAHRIAASAAGIAIIGLLLVAATQRPVLKRQTAIAAAGLLVAVALASIGAQFSSSMSGPPSPLVTLLNLGGGFALLALLWWSRSITSPQPLAPLDQRTWMRWLAALTLLAAIVQIGLGGLVSAKFGALSCPSFPACRAPWPQSALLSVFDPTQPLEVGTDGVIVRPAALAALLSAHRAGALFLAAFAVLLLASLLRANGIARSLGAVLAVLLITQLALGAAQTLLEIPLALVLAHNLTAALLLCTLVSVNRYAHARAASL